MSGKQSVSIEEVEKYIKESGLVKWAPGQIDYIMDAAFSQEHQDVCAINLVVGKQFLHKTEYCNNIFLVWKTKEGHIKHCIIMKNTQDLEYVYTESVVVSQTEIVVRIFCANSDAHSYVINAHFPIAKIA